MTSAETVLITQQSQEELYRALKENAQLVQVGAGLRVWGVYVCRAVTSLCIALHVQMYIHAAGRYVQETVLKLVGCGVEALGSHHKAPAHSTCT